MLRRMDCEFCDRDGAGNKCRDCGGRFCAEHLGPGDHGCSDAWRRHASSVYHRARRVEARRRNLKVAASLILFVLIPTLLFQPVALSVSPVTVHRPTGTRKRSILSYDGELEGHSRSGRPGPSCCGTPLLV